MLGKISGVVLCILFSLSAAAISRSLSNDFSQALTSSSPVSRFTPDAVRLLSLGYYAAVKDLLVIWNTQSIINQSSDQLSSDMALFKIKSASQHHPRHSLFYQFGCFLMLKTYKKPELCETIIRDGLQALNNDWNLALIQGFIFEFELGNSTLASIYFNMAANSPGAPEHIKLTANRLLSLSLNERSSAELIELVNKIVQNESLRDQLIENIKKRNSGE